MYAVGEEQVPLCLRCYIAHRDMVARDQEQNERLINFLSDQMDATIGFGPSGPRFPPRPSPVIIAGAKMHNISVSNSVVGTINTGSIGTVDQTISVLREGEEPQLGDAVKQLTEAILGSGDLTSNQKNELVDLLSVVSAEAVAPKAERKTAVAAALLDRAAKITDLANDIADVCAKWWPVLLAGFGLVSGQS
jgi:hypothetical protein